MPLNERLSKGGGCLGGGIVCFPDHKSGPPVIAVGVKSVRSCAPKRPAPLGGVALVLQDAGFRLGNVSVTPPVTAPQTPSTFTDAAPTAVPALPPQPTPASIVVSQNPAPGAKIVIGAAIDLEVR